MTAAEDARVPPVKKRKRAAVSAKTMREMHALAKAHSRDPSGYVRVSIAECAFLADLMDWIADPLGVLQGLDLFRQLYGSSGLHDYAKGGEPAVMSKDHPVFRMAACVSVACKYASQQSPAVFSIVRRQLMFRTGPGEEFDAEMDVLARTGFSPFKLVETPDDA